MLGKMKALITAMLVFTAAGCGGEGTEPSAGAGGTTATTSSSGPGATSGGGGQTPGQAPGPQDLPFESGTGYFEVDGERFEPSYIVNCQIPDDFFDNPAHPDDLDLRGHKLADGVGLEVSVSAEDLVSPTDPQAEFTSKSVRLFLHQGGPEGIEQYEGQAVAWTDGAWYDSTDWHPTIAFYSGVGPTSPPLQIGFEIGDSRIQGTLTLAQIWPETGTGTVDVTFDYTIPSEEFDCDEL